MTRTSHLTLALAALLAAPAFAATFDANVELDTDYRNLGRGAAQGGRVEFNAAGKTESGGFVAGRASYLAKKDGTAGVDDMWVQFGNATGDIKLGRFEAADLFPVGKDTIVENDGVNGFRNTLRGRFGADGTYGEGIAHGALTLNAAPGLSIELGLVASHKNTGVRPVVSYTMDNVTVRFGIEAGKLPTGQKINGGAVTVGTTVGGGTINVNFGRGDTKTTTGGVETKTTGTSFGVNAVFGPLGVAYILDRDKTTAGTLKENNVYVAYSLPLFGTGATITPAIGYSKATGPGTDGNSPITARVRVNYTF
jgi:hypothetical protein